MQIEGASVLVSGGASGLGEATARLAAARGARVMIADIRDERAAALAAEIGARSVRCDVASAQDAQSAVRAALDAFGSLDVLVNCAGVALGERTVSKDGPHDLVRFEQVLSVNLVGTFNMLRLAAEAMAKQPPSASGGRGVVINTASAAAFEGQVGQAAYAASKGGVVAMTLPIARDLARLGVRVVTIAPGLFRTPMLEAIPKEALAALAAQVPFPARLGEPEEYARLALHIVDNDMLNGETIRLDGALRMGAR